MYVCRYVCIFGLHFLKSEIYMAKSTSETLKTKNKLYMTGKRMAYVCVCIHRYLNVYTSIYQNKFSQDRKR